jgi:cobalt/nickel transport protein
MLAAALAVAGFVGPFGCRWPDGLEKVAGRLGLAPRVGGLAPLPAPLPNYQVPGLHQERMSTAVAGLLGTLVVFVLVWGVGRLLAARAGRADAAAD